MSLSGLLLAPCNRSEQGEGADPEPVEVSFVRGEALNDLGAVHGFLRWERTPYFITLILLAYQAQVLGRLWTEFRGQFT